MIRQSAGDSSAGLYKTGRPVLTGLHMKRTLIPLFLLFLSLSGLPAESVSDTVRQARLLAEERKYESAMNLLNAADRDNQNPRIAVEKSRLCRLFFVQNINHALFALKDLAPEEDLDRLREGTGTFRIFMFDSTKILPPLLAGEDGAVSNELGLYYHSIQILYGDSLNEQYGDVRSLSLGYLETAYKTFGYYDPDSWEILGKEYYGSGRGEEALKMFARLAEEKPEDPEICFTYGLMLFQDGNYREAVPYMQTAVRNYRIEEYRIDALSLLGSLYYLTEAPEPALECFREVIAVNPYDYRIYERYVDTLLKTGNREEADEKTRQFLMLEPANSFVPEHLLPVFNRNDQLDAYRAIILSCLEDVKGNPLAEANFLFHLGGISINQERPKEETVRWLTSARKKFVEAAGESHPAVQAIDGYLNGRK